jgi:hypothetical protein
VDHVAHLGVTTQSDGLTHLSVETEESTNLDIAFIQRPTRAAVQEILVLTPRLRIQIDGRTFEAWHNATYTVDLTKGRQPEVQVDIGAENARAHITVWERGKQRFQRGLDAHGVGRVIEESLEGTSRIEIDADNLGRVVLIPRYSVVTPFRKDKINDRLVWRDLALSQDLNAEQPMIPTLLEIPRPNTSLIVRHVQSAGSVRARLALRQRIKNEESRS